MSVYGSVDHTLSRIYRYVYICIPAVKANAVGENLDHIGSSVVWGAVCGSEVVAALDSIVLYRNRELRVISRYTSK